MKKTNIFAILSLVSIVAGYIISMFVKDVETIMIICLITSILAVIFAIVGLVQSKKLEKGKVLSIIMLIIGILGSLLFLVMVSIMNMVKDPKNTKELCEKVVNCKQGADGVSTCYLENDTTKLIPIKCYDTNLNQDQYE